jgi:hypothetical protein
MPSSEPDQRPAALRHSSASLSALLIAFAANFTAERVRVRDITESLGQRSFGFILLIFALPNSLPIIGIPGVSTITGLPMLFIAVQMALGHKRVYLPRWIADSSIATVDFQKLVNKVAPWLRRIEKLMRPRISVLTLGSAERWLGAFCVLLAFLLVLPIPLGNLLPALGILFDRKRWRMCAGGHCHWHFSLGAFERIGVGGSADRAGYARSNGVMGIYRGMDG